MRLYLGCVVATALLASRISAEVNFVATSKRLSGVYGEPLLANQQNAKDSKEIPLQYATDEKIGLLRGTATEQTTSPLIDKTTYFTPRQAAGDEYGQR
ncbi:hypothetical protein GQ600_11479 [Phytophthora cactorum]|nr:hypothetical protein GQ600_11479 [Phytophthora cactorum]